MHSARLLSYNLTNHAARQVVYAEKYKECLRFHEKPTVWCVYREIYISVAEAGRALTYKTHIWKYDCSLPYIIFLFSPLRLNHRSDEIDDRMSFIFLMSPPPAGTNVYAFISTKTIRF